MNQQPLILVTNDDGIEAAGLWHLAEALRGIAEIMVAAPAVQHSGAGAAFTLYRQLQSERAHSRVAGIDAWQISGTPVDAVLIGLRQHAPRRVAMIVAGVNPGPNLGTDLIYSGTVGAAMQGYQQGLPALAISLASHEPAHLPAAAAVGARLAKALLAAGEPLLLNVNVPARPLEELSETRITVAAPHGAERLIDERTADGMIQRRLEDRDTPPAPEGTDLWAVQHGYVSVTPLHTDLTAHHALDAARRIILP